MLTALLTSVASSRPPWPSHQLALLGVGLLVGACSGTRPASLPTATRPAPVDKALYATIARQDSLLFVAFNRHDLAQLQTFFAEDLEFYHDKGGLANYEQNLAGFRRLFEQNKTTGLNRQLVPGTLEVYPVKGYGAVETYEHRFCHQENGQADCGTFKNMMIWRLQDGQWKVTRVVSYGH
ncbi:nuclear transport factor 2 family protein [Hymenobacter sp. BT635]|uniref:Nuclear transport factor 2 family protein n=1 Tax=Hymenobacter nitidus TaxID=2880929 RepID=A0ABS8A8X9_9BACT|nr:nuclear transport factor 2 family protein [Hymenobacter nitidus]MCB2376679.1 nuclear transport factor 2 family protein [Hymenobacter nitidus]